MFNRFIRMMAATVVFALAVLAFSSGPASATTPHASTASGLQLELAAHPVFIEGTTAFTQEQLAAMPLQLRAQSQCVGPNGGPSYSLCVWDGPNYTGAFYNWNTYWLNFCVPVGQPFTNAVSSGWNTYWLNFCVPVGQPFTNAVSSGWNNMPGYHYDFYDNMGCNSKLFGWNYGAKGNWDYASNRMESFEGHYGNN